MKNKENSIPITEQSLYTASHLVAAYVSKNDSVFFKSCKSLGRIELYGKRQYL